MLDIAAALPIAVFFGLVLLAHRSVLSSALVSLVLVVVTSLTVWQMDAWRIASAGAKGVFMSLEIILIVLGALIILETLQQAGMLSYLKRFFEKISRDERAHVILIAWGLIYFLEGVAGFGTPPMIAVPLLLALGFRPLTAVALTLISDTVPVAFGAIGLPITYGINSAAGAAGAVAGAAGAGVFPLGNISILVAALNIIGGILVPALLIFVFTKLEKKPISHFIEFLPFAVVAGLVTSVAAFLTALIAGPELPSIVGGIVALVVISLMARYRILIPRTEALEKLPEPLKTFGLGHVIKAVSPYFALLSLLLITRLSFLPVKGWATETFSFELSSLFGHPIDYSFSPLYSAGMLIILSAAIAFIIFHVHGYEMRHVISAALRKTAKPFFTLSAILALVQIFVYSADNAAGYASMPMMLAGAAASAFGSVWPIFAPWIGALGAFAVGSATVSNLLFAGFQYQTAIATGFSPVLILALQAIGATAGNMIAFHNVITAAVVAGIAGREYEIIRINILPLIGYLAIIGAVGMVIAAAV